MAKEKLIEVCRSFGRKCNLGNYESADFFESRKEEVPESEADETSARLFKACKEKVEKDADDYLMEQLRSKMPPEKPMSYEQGQAWQDEGEARRQSDK